ncbi:uncharacterized protein LOC142336280 [Convolutriloba macropyga]|uniref:uncharacterized protein LOC142336280 n=1 Tax=Convolutriloba macropyga TaxID=536237 RepID=UPI003F524CAE
MADSSGSWTSENSGVPENSESSEASPNFVLVPELSNTSSICNAQDFYTEIQAILLQNEVEEEAVEWILNNFYKWKTIDELDESEDLSVKRIRLLKSALLKKFETFTSQRQVFLKYLVSIGTDNDIVWNSPLLMFWAKGSESAKEFIASDEPLKYFSASTVNEMRNFWFGNPKQEGSSKGGDAGDNNQADIERKVEGILRDCNLHDEAIQEVLSNFASFDELEKGLMSCEELSKKQAKLLVEKLSAIFQEMHAHDLNTSCEHQDFSLIFQDLGLPEEAIEWINQNLKNCVDANGDLSFLEECEDLSKKQLKLVKEKLRTWLQLDKSETIVSETVDFQSRFLRQVELQLNEQSGLDEAIKEWILSNIATFDTIDDLETNEDLSKKQIRVLKSNLQNLFDHYREQKATVGDQCAMFLEDIEAKACEKFEKSPLLKSEDNGVQHEEMGMEIEDAPFKISITPLILCHAELQEGFSVEKFILSEAGVKHICSLVPEHLLGETPIIYNLNSTSDVIDFKTMDKLSIGCVGLFGPLKAVVQNFKGYVPQNELKSLEHSLCSQKCGLYLVDVIRAKIKFLVFKSDDEVEFKLVRKDSRAVHFLRYMSQLCNNVVMCLDGNYEDRLSTSEERVVVKSDRRNRYNLKKHELQQESFSLRNLGFFHEQVPFNSKMFVSENGMIMAKFEEVKAYIKPSILKKPADVSQIKVLLESTKIEHLEDICKDFKTEFLKENHKDQFESIKNTVDEQIEKLRRKAEADAHDSVMFSAVLYFLKYCDFGLELKIIEKLYGKDEESLWGNRIQFSLTSINDPIALKDETEIKESLKKFCDSKKSIRKFLLWMALLKTDEGIEERVLSKGCNDASWTEVKDLAVLHFGSRFPYMTGINLQKEMEKSEEEIDYGAPTELLTSHVDKFMSYVSHLIEPYASKPKFVAFCQMQATRKFDQVKKEKLQATVVENFDKFMIASSAVMQNQETTDIIKCITSLKSSVKRFEYTIQKSLMEPAKIKLTFHRLALSRSEHQKLSTTDALLNVRELEFHRSGVIQYAEAEKLVACFPLEGNYVLLLFNVDKVSKTVVYNLPNVSKPQLDMHFGKTVSSCAYDCKARVLAVQSEMDLGVIQLFKFGEDYKSRHGLKPIEIGKIFGVETVVECCLQPNSRFLWFLHDSRLRKMDYKNGTMVNKAIRFDDQKPYSLNTTPDGSCLLVIDEDNNARPVMTETCNLLETSEGLSQTTLLFSICGQMIAIQPMESGFNVHQVLVTGAQHQTKLNKRGGLDSQNTSASPGTDETDDEKSHWIHYIYWMYTKFPCNDLLQIKQESLKFWFSAPGYGGEFFQKVASESNSIWNRLQMMKKPLDYLQLRRETYSSLCNIQDLQVNATTLGKFLIKLITFIPVQIARCQSNEFYVLDKGQPVSLESVNVAFDLIDKINLGFYESIFNAWSGSVKIISSMGKQTTGKSYTLNHLTGSSFNIAGTRCTDGCWLTVKEHDDCLYVILDFEGLGSFERTEQDDMLLSLFNSSISTITIFKTEKRLDRDVDKMFNKINLGSDQLKGTDKVFKGKFMIVINDVAEQDVKDTPKEFEEKISNIVSKSENNFIKKLYNSDFEIMAFPAFESGDYYESMEQLISIVQDEIQSVFNGGPEFIATMKLLMAKLAINDFSPLDRQQIDERIRFLRSLLPFAVQYGQISDDYPKKKELHLKSLDNPAFKISLHKEIELVPLGKVTLNDFEIVFKGNHLDNLVLNFLSILEPTSENLFIWRESLENFVFESIVFRFERVTAWLEENVRKWNDSDNSEYHDAIKVLMENLENQETNFRQTHKFCDEKCHDCFLKCTQIANHKSTHRCSTNHKCPVCCDYCEDGKPCKMAFGHEGKHLCAEVSHVCSEPCRFKDLNGCTGECQKMTGHEEEHECSEKKHPCKEMCSLDGCEGRCVVPCDEEHSVHKCTKEQCIAKCCVKTCTNKCSALDHFHGNEELSNTFKVEQDIAAELPFLLDDGNRIACEEHFCGKEHQCDQDCMNDGYCHVWTEKELKDETFEGERDTFTYSLKFVEKGEKLKCRQKLKPFAKFHNGDHSCSTEVHFCMMLCPTCENICSKAVNHENDGDVLHHARHGNMRKCFFVANEDDIQVGSHKYKVGEPAVAEMCHIFCNTLGRGHIHIVECDNEDPSSCVYSAKNDGRRHQTTKYQPNPEVPKDEITHEAYWSLIGFQDPCQELDCEDFEKCPAYCAAETHEKDEETSFCEFGVWHDPVRSLADVGRTSGFLTKDGHVFPCSHPSGVYHFVLCLDDSGSMSGNPWRELVSAVDDFVQRRKTLSSSDKISIAIHNHATRVVAEYQPITSFASSWLTFNGGENDFSLALRTSDGLIGRHLEKNVKPVLVFMSDGIWYDGEVEMEEIARKYTVANGLDVYTLGFGSINFDKLRELARLGKGQYLEAVNGLQLKTAFVEISAKHPATIGISF